MIDFLARVLLLAGHIVLFGTLVGLAGVLMYLVWSPW